MRDTKKWGENGKGSEYKYTYSLGAFKIILVASTCASAVVYTHVKYVRGPGSVAFGEYSKLTDDSARRLCCAVRLASRAWISSVVANARATIRVALASVGIAADVRFENCVRRHDARHLARERASAQASKLPLSSLPVQELCQHLTHVPFL
eukprot:IDg15410t1